jgi:hypothetical protein
MLDWHLSHAFSLARAGRWFLESGIQEPSGGVARFYLSDIGKNKPVSTEITGYTASALVYLFEVTGEDTYLERARQTARFLLDQVWDEPLGAFPFEHPSPSVESHHHTYFFDCGIIVCGLLAVWRHTREPRLLEVAHTAARAMVADFHSGFDYHPVLELPAKEPLPRAERWSRLPGCYQLKAALGWNELAEVESDGSLRKAWLEMLDAALATHRSFLDSGDASPATMDKLHAYCYFLEGLTPVLDQAACAQVYAEGIATVSGLVRRIEPFFVRSDVLAQLLRARLYGARVVVPDAPAAASEAAALATFQASGDDPRIDGGFVFGRRDGAMSPHINPVSTAFALQALEMWRRFQAEGRPVCRRTLI